VRTAAEKGREILEEFTQLTGYDRCYAAYLLRQHGKRVALRGGVFCWAKFAREREKTYGAEVLKVLKRIWLIMDCICSKRLAACLTEVIPILDRHREIKLTKRTRFLLLQISAATI